MKISSQDLKEPNTLKLDKGNLFYVYWYAALGTLALPDIFK